MHKVREKERTRVKSSLYKLPSFCGKKELVAQGKESRDLLRTKWLKNVSYRVENWVDFRDACENGIFCQRAGRRRPPPPIPWTILAVPRTSSPYCGTPQCWDISCAKIIFCTAVQTFFATKLVKISYFFVSIKCSVADLWHNGTDLDPRIRTFD